jgi:hypothetical protein
MVRRSSRVAHLAEKNIAKSTNYEGKKRRGTGEKKKTVTKRKKKKKKVVVAESESLTQRGAWILNKPEFRTNINSTLSPTSEIDTEGDSFPASNKKLRRLISNATKDVYGKNLLFEDSDSSDDDDGGDNGAQTNNIVNNSTAELLKKSNFALHNGTSDSSNAQDEYEISNNNYKKRNYLPHDVTRPFITPKMTPGIQRDLEVIKMRSFADPKRFYKKSDSRRPIPKEFQLGTIIEGNNEFKSARLSKKNRKQTIADELYSNKRVRKYTGKVFHETQRLNDNRKSKKRRK